MTEIAHDKEASSTTELLPSILFVEDNSNDFVIARHHLAKIELRNPINLVATADLMFKYLHGEPPFLDRAAFPMPAVIILDLNLPQIDGLRAQAMLRASLKFRDIRIIVISGPARQTMLKTAVDLGADAYMVKPFRAEDFKSLAGDLGLPMQFADD